MSDFALANGGKTPVIYFRTSAIRMKAVAFLSLEGMNGLFTQLKAAPHNSFLAFTDIETARSAASLLIEAGFTSKTDL